MSKEAWDAAWKAFHASTKEIDRLAKADGVSVKLTLPALGWKKPKKVKAMPKGGTV